MVSLSTHRKRIMTILILHAKRTDFDHEFIELFTSMDLLNNFLSNNPNVQKVEITLHEVNPT